MGSVTMTCQPYKLTCTQTDLQNSCSRCMEHSLPNRNVEGIEYPALCTCNQSQRNVCHTRCMPSALRRQSWGFSQPCNSSGLGMGQRCRECTFSGRSSACTRKGCHILP